MYPILAPFYLILLVYSRLKSLNIYYINCIRIGHFVPDGYMQSYELRKALEAGKKVRNVYVIYFKTCNESLAKYIETIMPVSRWLSLFLPINYRVPKVFKLIDQLETKPHKSRDHTNILRDYDPIPFPQRQLDTTYSCLNNIGWTEEPITTLIVRDRAFLDRANFKSARNDDWEYHDYRDSDVDCYSQLIERVTVDSFLIRVGNASYRQIEHGKSRYDLTQTSKNECIDYIIPTLSESIITTGTGIDAIGFVYNIPMMYVNILPLALLNTWSNVYQVPKRLFFKDNGKELGLKDYIKAKYTHTREFTRNGIGFESRKGDELVEYYDEFSRLFLSKQDEYEAYDRLSKEEIEMINEFYSIRSSCFNELDKDTIYRNSFPSPLWLRKMAN